MIVRRTTFIPTLLFLSSAATAAALLTQHVQSFGILPKIHQPFHSLSYKSSNTRRAATLLNNNDDDASFDPLHLSNSFQQNQFDLRNTKKHSIATVSTASSLILLLTSLPTQAIDETITTTTTNTIDQFNPQTFQPVCPTSDTFYRFLQSLTTSIVGEQSFIEYGPLIAGGLLRIRLELCVVESFFNEAVGPFIEQRGLSWILPLHETVETFLAGTVFAVASTFILVGSTKIVTVIVTYGDVFLGGPCRLVGGFLFDRVRGRPVVLDVGFGFFKKRIVGPPVSDDDEKKKKKKKRGEDGGLEDWFDLEGVEMKDFPLVLGSGGIKAVGEVSKITREVMEAIDLFVGRYLTLIATGYVALKFLHFKVFPDFPPF